MLSKPYAYTYPLWLMVELIIVNPILYMHAKKDYEVSNIHHDYIFLKIVQIAL